jgi:hypothetical protein
MSARIEHTDSLTLLRELPDGWAQTCITQPPRADAPDRTLAILAESRRVLRDDGTLWLFTAPAESYLEDLREEGWQLQTTPVWARPLAAYGRPALRLFLLSKQSRYFYDTSTIGAYPAPSLWVSGSCRVRRIQSCVPAREHERGLRLVKRCVMAGSSLLACGECGAPYRRARPGESAPGLRHPTCSHNNPDGRCLVLDPFYRPGLPSAEAALCSGRSFLGITDTASEGR